MYNIYSFVNWVNNTLKRQNQTKDNAEESISKLLLLYYLSVFPSE